MKLCAEFETLIALSYGCLNGLAIFSLMWSSTMFLILVVFLIRSFILFYLNINGFTNCCGGPGLLILGASSGGFLASSGFRSELIYADLGLIICFITDYFSIFLFNKWSVLIYFSTDFYFGFIFFSLGLDLDLDFSDLVFESLTSNNGTLAVYGLLYCLFSFPIGFYLIIYLATTTFGLSLIKFNFELTLSLIVLDVSFGPISIFACINGDLPILISAAILVTFFC